MPSSGSPISNEILKMSDHLLLAFDALMGFQANNSFQCPAVEAHAPVLDPGSNSSLAAATEGRLLDFRDAEEWIRGTVDEFADGFHFRGRESDF